MHQAQKKAIFALLDAAESQLDAVKTQLGYARSMLLMGDGDAPPTGRTADVGSPAAAPSPYLSVDEEEELTKHLEAERLQAVKEEEAKIQAEWALQRQAIRSETTAAF